MLGNDSLRLANILTLHSRIFTNHHTRTDKNHHFCAAVENVDVRPVSALASSVDPDLKFPESPLRHISNNNPVCLGFQDHDPSFTTVSRRRAMPPAVSVPVTRRAVLSTSSKNLRSPSV